MNFSADSRKANLVLFYIILLKNLSTTLSEDLVWFILSRTGCSLGTKNDLMHLLFPTFLLLYFCVQYLKRSQAKLNK